MKVCLVGVNNPCHNPRLTREADTLAALGHEVRVVAPSRSAALAEKDRRLMSHRSWRLDSVDVEVDKKLGQAVIARGLRRVAAEASRYVHHLWIHEQAYVPALGAMIRAACRERADWYIAHAQGALPIAARAARRWNAQLGFDCEDLLSLCDTDPRETVLALERAYLQQSAYVSVTSHRMAEYLHGQYRLQPSILLYNVFPLAHADGLLPPSERPERALGAPLRLHWFGQTIGAGRGLEEVIDAIGLLNGPAELHLRGGVRAEFKERLVSRAAAIGRGTALHFHPPVDHDEVIRGMGEFDVGVALERPENQNYSLTVTNKFFSYMLAGLAIAATDTPGQREVYQAVPEAAALYPAGDANALAKILSRWQEHPEALRATQAAAWQAARERYCWDIESAALVARLNR